MAKQDEMTNRSIAILVNLSAGLDETGLECDGDRIQLTSNLRLASAAGAAALTQRAKRTTPFSNQAIGSNVKLVKSAANWLDQLKQAKGFHGDVTAAEFLGVSQTQFSRWRTGKDLLDNYNAWLIAVALNVNPMAVIGSVGFHHSRDTDRTRWLAMLSSVIDAELPAIAEPVCSGPAPTATLATEEAVPVPVPSAQGSKWTDEEDQRLVEAYQSGSEVGALAVAHRRSTKAILLRLSQTHRLINGEHLSSLCELYGVSLTSLGRSKKTERKKKPSAATHADTVFL